MVLTDVAGERGLPRYFAQVFRRAQGIQCGRLDATLPDGRVFRVEGSKPGPVAALEIHNPDVFARLLREGDLGFAEAYLDGWWSTPDLMSFMQFISAGNDAVYEGFRAEGIARVYERIRFWLKSNTRTQAKRNIEAHYDLGNDFYALWLDETMTYSSAMFEHGQESLEKAQIRKYAHLVDEMGARPGDHVLEIGCGWGGFAEYAARERGLRVTALTISRAQHDYAVERIRRAGLQDRVEIRLQDYRDETGTYDGIASIEMFEAVGQRYWPTYFETVRERLKPGAKATLQIILIEDRRWERYRKSVDFIQRYVFPGGMLPSPTVLREEIRKAGLAVQNSVEFGPDYGQTCRRWYETFNERWNDVAALGFDARFKRMWDFYLASCAAGFEHAICDVTQITVARRA